MSRIERLRRKIRERAYLLSGHAEEEMLADNLEREDVEHAIIEGFVAQRYTGDARGTRYRIEGPARDGTMICVVCRFRLEGDLILITVFAKEDVG
jgi:hypothetical protein